MARRALILGSQIEGLRGVHNDCRSMATMLDRLGFAIDMRLDGAATREGMLDGYDRLIAESESDDAAVVYYCGHGYHANVAAEGRSWQCIAPTDLRTSTITDWRGITAWELSIRLQQLTEKTRNATVLLDCCHSAQLSRSDIVSGSIARTLPHPVQVGFDQHLAELRSIHRDAFDAVDVVGNLDAVRVVACGQSESAFEYPDAAGQYHGAFTEALIEVLTQVGPAAVSWAAIIGTIRARVLRQFRLQRPDVEGPVHRGVFALAQQHGAHNVPVIADGDVYCLEAGELTGAAVGDIYAVLPHGAYAHGDQGALAELQVIEVSPMRAIARRASGAVTISPAAVAVRIRRGFPRWPIALDGPETARAVVQEALGSASRLRVADDREHGTLATIRIEGHTVFLEDAAGSLFPRLRFPAELDRVMVYAGNLAAAQEIRELEGEHGVHATEVSIELGVVADGQKQPLSCHGTVLGLQDRYYVHIETRTQRTIFVHLLCLSANAKIRLLTHFACSGVALDPRARSLTVGRRADGAFVGVGLRWPEGVPETGVPKLTELVVIATLTATDLSCLETREGSIAQRGSDASSSAIDVLCGATQRGNGALDGFYVKRLSFLLDPSRRLTGGTA